jgi:hypothetical protein
MRKRFASIGLVVAATMLAIGPTHLSAQATNPLKLVKGTIKDEKTGKPIDGGRLNVYTGSSRETVTSSKINPKTGFYQVILGPGTQYRFEVVSPRFYTTDIAMTTPPGANYEEIVKDLSVKPIPMGTVLFSGRLFDVGSASLKESPELRRVTDDLKKSRTMAVTITVVPDLAAAAKKAAPKKKKKGKGTAVAEIEQPAPANNPAATLGNDRVTSLKNYFKGQGISTTRLAWDVRPSVQSPSKGKLADNVTIKITSIMADENDD